MPCVPLSWFCDRQLYLLPFYYFIYFADPGLIDLQREVMKESLSVRAVCSMRNKGVMLESIKGDKPILTFGQRILSLWSAVCSAVFVCIWYTFGFTQPEGIVNEE